MSDKSVMINEIQEGMGKLLPLMDLCKLPAGFYAIPDQMEEVRTEYLQEALSWIQHTLATIYADWRTIRKQQSEERWNWILFLDPDTYAGFREVVMHKAAVQAARKWLFSKNRPEMFKVKQQKRILGE